MEIVIIDPNSKGAKGNNSHNVDDDIALSKKRKYDDEMASVSQALTIVASMPENPQTKKMVAKLQAKQMELINAQFGLLEDDDDEIDVLGVMNNTSSSITPLPTTTTTK